MTQFIYKGKNKREISFPVGGIGTGCIGIAGNGALIDWQIKGRPNLGGTNGFTHFAVKAEKDGKFIDARVLNSDLDSAYIGDGSGPNRLSMAGMPHFKDVTFRGEYPLCEMTFSSKKFPGIVRETAFNPFIPLNEDDSSIPGAVFAFEIENTAEKTLDYTIALAINNPANAGHTINRFVKENSINMLTLTGDDLGKDEKNYIDMTAATDCPDISYQEYFYRGFWFDQLAVYWDNFTENSRFKNRTYNGPADSRDPDGGVLAAHIKLNANEKKSVRFVISWNVPNMYNYWSNCSKDCDCKERPTWKHYYAKLFEDSKKSAAYLLTYYDLLYQETKTFHDALYNSSLPDYVLDAVSANLAILKSPTCLRLENGEFYAFEGCGNDCGCCEGSCTHVWNYAYTLAFLFPKLERSMRDLDYTYSFNEDGSMPFRLMLPLGSSKSNFRPCVDGQMGNVMKVYRDWKISGDHEWLRNLWPKIKKSIEYAWSDKNTDSWDRNEDGVLEGRQHHTLDMELFGPSAWLNGFYLLALRAGAEMAEFLGDVQAGKQFNTIFEKGKAFVNKELYNGEYFIQKINLEDKEYLNEYAKISGIYQADAEKDDGGRTAADVYWSDELNQIKYQIGEGCLTDQLLAQWHANISGLGRIFDPKKTKKALCSIYRYNYKKDGFRDFANPCRLYALNDEKGLTVCSWPYGYKKPKMPIPYSQEVFNGIEYAAAALMIQEGEIKKGLSIVKSARERFKGDRRNPWDEIECGNYYARSLSSYSLLLSLCGFEFDRGENYMGFSPVEMKNKDTDFQTFWTFGDGWGTFKLQDNKAILNVLYGGIKLASLKIQGLTAKKVTQDDKTASFKNQNGKIVFSSDLSLNIGSNLTLILE